MARRIDRTGKDVLDFDPVEPDDREDPLDPEDWDDFDPEGPDNRRLLRKRRHLLKGGEAGNVLEPTGKQFNSRGGEMNPQREAGEFVFAPTKAGFAVHVKGCPGLGRHRNEKAIVVPQAEIGDHVADARERGHTVRYCPCTNITESAVLTEVEELPPEPGTAPVPEGHVRLYHQTSADNVDSIRQHGIQLAKAKGIEGPRAVYATETPFYGSADSHPTVEFSVPAAQFNRPHMVYGSVDPSEIVAIHLPWHSHARYIEQDPEVLANTLAGKDDDLMDMPDYGEAIRYIKAKHGAKAEAAGEPSEDEPSFHIGQKLQKKDGGEVTVTDVGPEAIVFDDGGALPTVMGFDDVEQMFVVDKDEDTDLTGSTDPANPVNHGNNDSTRHIDQNSSDHEKNDRYREAAGDEFYSTYEEWVAACNKYDYVIDTPVKGVATAQSRAKVPVGNTGLSMGDVRGLWTDKDGGWLKPPPNAQFESAVREAAEIVVGPEGFEGSHRIRAAEIMGSSTIPAYVYKRVRVPKTEAARFHKAVGPSGDVVGRFYPDQGDGYLRDDWRDLVDQYAKTVGPARVVTDLSRKYKAVSEDGIIIGEFFVQQRYGWVLGHDNERIRVRAKDYKSEQQWKRDALERGFSVAMTDKPQRKPLPPTAMGDSVRETAEGEAQFNSPATNPYHKVLTKHGFITDGPKHGRNQFAPKGSPAGDYTEFRYTHPEHGKSHVITTHYHVKDRDGQHSWLFRHEQSNGIMAPSHGNTKPQLDRSLSREYGDPAKPATASEAAVMDELGMTTNATIQADKFPPNATLRGRKPKSKRKHDVERTIKYEAPMDPHQPGQTSIELDSITSVSDYLDKADGRSGEAFELAAADDRAGMRAAKADVRSVLGHAANQVRITGLKFSDFDAANPGHAGAHWHYTVEGPEELIAKLRADWEGQSGEPYPPDQGELPLNPQESTMRSYEREVFNEMVIDTGGIRPRAVVGRPTPAPNAKPKQEADEPMPPEQGASMDPPADGEESPDSGDNFEIQDLGVDNPQYFQGASALHTDWDEVAIGVGSTPAEAYDDACEQVAQSVDHFDKIGLPDTWGSEESDLPEPEGDDDGDSGSEMQHYVAVYYKAPADAGQGELPLAPQTEAGEKRWRVLGYGIGEDGTRTDLGDVIITAPNRREAGRQAQLQLWDPRLDAASVTWDFTAEEMSGGTTEAKGSLAQQAYEAIHLTGGREQVNRRALRELGRILQSDVDAEEVDPGMLEQLSDDELKRIIRLRESKKLTEAATYSNFGEWKQACTDQGATDDSFIWDGPSITAYSSSSRQYIGQWDDKKKEGDIDLDGRAPYNSDFSQGEPVDFTGDVDQPGPVDTMPPEGPAGGDDDILADPAGDDGGDDILKPRIPKPTRG